MNKKLIISLLMIGVMAFGAGLGTFAWFTSSAVSNDNEFKTGTLTLGINDDTDGSYAFNLGTIGNMAPGDKTEEVVLNIQNKGTIDLAWAGKFEIDPTTDISLAKAIYIEDAKMEFLDPNGNIWRSDYTADHFITNGKGSATYGHFNQLEDPDMGGVITLEKFLADGGMSPTNPGIQMGALRPGYSYRFTFKLGMAEAADNNYQGKSMKLKYVVDSTQVNAGALAKLRNDLSGHFGWFYDQLEVQGKTPILP